MLRPAALTVLAACSTPAPPATPAAPAADARPALRERPVNDDGYWVTRTDAALDAALQQACETAKSKEQPLLIQFSAPWCVDCRRMRAMSAEPPLAPALAGWTTLVVDPGRFDRHEALLQAFEVSRLATWVAVAPTDCQLPATAWPRLAHGAFEPATGTPVTAEALVAWLDAARAAKP